MTLLDRIIEAIHRDAQLVRATLHQAGVQIEAAVENAVFGPLTDAQIDKLLSARQAMLEDGAKMDPRHSIVDLLKVIGFPHDLAARKEIAQNLGWSSSDKVDGSAESNLRLSEAVLSAVRHRQIVAGPA